MTLSPPQEQEFYSLLDALLEELIDDASMLRLTQLLSENPECQRLYVSELNRHAELTWGWGRFEKPMLSGNEECSLSPPPDIERESLFERGRGTDTNATGSPIVINISTPKSDRKRLPRLLRYVSQIGPFSYLVSAVLMIAAVLIAWQYKMSDHRNPLDQGTAGSFAANATAPGMEGPFVGRVTAMEDCRLAENAPLQNDNAQHVSHNRQDMTVSSSVGLGKTIQLDSGLLEITYQSGARVLLQGPVTFEVDQNGGFLKVGKLTGKYEKNTESGTPRTEGSNPQSLIPNPSFVIRTPTAMVTDLGTKFGVEVDAGGSTTSHVFARSVKIHPAAAADDQQDCVLREKEAGRVVAESSLHDAAVRRVEFDPGRFVRNINGRRISIHAFPTGIDVADGLGYDRHWQVVAVSNTPDFQPQAARLARTMASWNRRGNARWITGLFDPGQSLPTGASVTFRTTFEMEDVVLGTAKMQGWFLTNGHVEAIRLNGETIPVPEHDEMACQVCQKFSLEHGFIEGNNVLELVVAKTDYAMGRGHPFVAICVDFESQVVEQ
jgi:hypothetical protein